MDPYADRAALVEASGLFDPEWYLARYPEVASYDLGPLTHFVRHGLQEGRDPGPRFSHAAYRDATAGSEPDDEPLLLRALRTRTPGSERLWLAPSAFVRMAILDSGIFDAAWYLRRNADVGRDGSDPLTHYIHFGMIENRQPGPEFEPDFYGETYPEYRDVHGNAAEHYLHVGRARGYLRKGPPAYERWVAIHDTLTEEDLAWIRRDGELAPTGNVHVLHILDAEGVEMVDALLDALRAQVGATWTVTFAPMLGLPPGIWAAFRSRMEGRRDARLIDAPGTVAASILAEPGLLVVCFGAVRLRPHALHAFARAAASRNADAAYSDHDVVDRSSGRRERPTFKPEISPEYQMRTGYIGPVIALRNGVRAPGETAFPSPEAFGSAQLLAEAVLSRPPRPLVVRVPMVLYHVPDHSDADQVNVRAEANADAIQAGREPSVSIVIPTRDRVELLQDCIESILRETDYPKDRFEIVVVDNGSKLDETLAYFQDVTARAHVRIVPSPGGFNFSRINNDGVRTCETDIVVLLNNDTTVNRLDWLRRLVERAVDPAIGIVGAQLLYPDGTVQHGGVILGVQGVAAHRNTGIAAEQAAVVDVTRELTSMTGACLALRRNLYWELGGLDPVLEVAFNDVKLCCLSAQAGYRNIYVALPLMKHHESKSRGYDTTTSMQDRNAREAVCAISEFRDLFRDDPAYNPNLSLLEVDEIAFPPRIVRPWRRGGNKHKVLILSVAHKRGYGVPVVVGEQAAALLRAGYEVIVGGPLHETDHLYPGCTRVDLRTVVAAADYAVSNAVDCVVAHTPPFFTAARLLGRDTLIYFVDYGEPNPEFFADRIAREHVNREKRLSSAYADHIFTISRTVYDQQFRKDAIVARIGNAHLEIWGPDWQERRRALRRKYGLENRFAVLNVCRFHSGERLYKGVDRYVEVWQELGVQEPAAKQGSTFLLAGRGDDDDIAAMQREGLTVFANVSEDEMRELYAAADLYMNLSRWEGYNLGIGQALAMGLPVVASDIEAHREFPIPVSNSAIALTGMVGAAHRTWSDGRAERTTFIEPWETSTGLLCDKLGADLSARTSRWS